jgi:hypothetical protein
LPSGVPSPQRFEGAQKDLMALIDQAEGASAWSFLCLPVERASLDHLCDPWRRTVGWLTFWLDDLCFRDFRWLGVGSGCGLDTQLLGSLKAPSKNRMNVHVVIAESPRVIWHRVES